MNRIKSIIKQIPGAKPIWNLFRMWYFKWYYDRMKDGKYPHALRRWYKRRTGETLDLENPKTFNEKIQWLKLYDSTPEKTMLADKYRVREWVAKKLGGGILIPLLGVWKNADDIDFDALPNRFVLKTNHSSGWNIIVKDKSKLNVKKTRKKLNNYLKLNFAHMGTFELHYKDISPIIIAEKYIENIDNDLLYDYRFLCFDDEPKYCWVDTGVTNRRRMIYDLDFNPQPFEIGVYPKIETPLTKPQNFEKMIECAKALCEGFKHVRVDLYNVNGKIYFGEMTFAPVAGTAKISPHEYDKLLGDMIKLN